MTAEAAAALRRRGAHLPVGQHRGVVALEAALDELAHAGRVHLLLPGVQVEDEVVGEGLVLAQEHLRLPRRDRGTDVTALNLLFGQLWPDSARDRRALVSPGGVAEGPPPLRLPSGHPQVPSSPHELENEGGG